MDAPNAIGPTQILIVRHAEKPPFLGCPRGVDRNGDPHEHSLTVPGWQRAGALVPFFCEPRDPAIAVPTSVFAPPALGQSGDHGRPYQTIVAVAERLGTAVDTTYAGDAEEELARALIATSGVVLVGWEHKRIPRIANALLGDAHTAPQAWPEDASTSFGFSIGSPSR